MPKPPPTSPTRTRTCSLTRPGSAAAMPSRTAVGIWLDSVTVSRPLAESGSASTTRGSIEAGARRWLTMSSDTTCAARWNAASAAAASPCFISEAMLSGACSHSTGAPGRMACSVSVTEGRSSKSTITASAPFIAASRDSATTAATASPTKRTRSKAMG